MRFYMACVTAHKKEIMLISSAARVLIAEDEAEAHRAAMLNCLNTYPTEQGYAEHQAKVSELCDEDKPLTITYRNGDVYVMRLSKRE